MEENISTETIKKMKRIEDIIQNRIDYEDIPSIIEWFIEEPEWENMYWLQIYLKEIIQGSKKTLKC